MSNLYELKMWRHNDLIGTVLFVTDPDTHPIPTFAIDWCERFRLGVDHDRATLSSVQPARITQESGSITTTRLLHEWGAA